MVASVFASIPVGGAASDASGPTASDIGGLTDIQVASAGSRGFLENLGQLDDEGISFYLDSPGLGVAFLDSAVLMDLRAGLPTPFDAIGHGPSALLGAQRDGPTAPAGGSDGCVVRLDFVGADRVRPVGRGPIPGEYNFMKSSSPAQWHLGVRAYSEVVYAGLYQGIDLVYRASPDGVKYEFLVDPGTDPSMIRVHADGQSSLAVDGRTDIVLDTSIGRLVDAGLLAYYRDDPAATVECGFVLASSDCYTFDVGVRDISRSLVIDPIVYSTYLGGGKYDIVHDIKVNASDGGLYAIGETTSNDFPTSTGAYQDRLRGDRDAFVTKFSLDGSTLEYSTFIGGSSDEVGESLDTDADGNVYLVGTTWSDDFPVSVDAVESTIGMGSNESDGFACKIDSTGSSLIYATYVGGSNEEQVISVDADDQGCAYFLGWTFSLDLEVTDGSFQSTMGGGYNDAFVCKLNSKGTQYIYSTYLGGERTDVSGGIVIDSTGCAYISGSTYSILFPVTDGTYSTQRNGLYDAFVSKFTADGSDLVWSTYLAGSTSQHAIDITLDSNGRPVVLGFTNSRDFPTTTGAYQTRPTGTVEDCFITVLTTNATDIFASTYLGGMDAEYPKSLCITPDGDVLASGGTYSDDFPTTPDAEQTSLYGLSDAFVSRLSSDLKNLSYSTYLGGSRYDEVNAITHDGNISLYLGGASDSIDFPVTTDALQSKNAGGAGDAVGVVCRFILDALPPIADAGDDVIIDQHQSVELNGSRSSDNLGVVNWTWTFRYNDSDIALYGRLRSFQFNNAGKYTITLTVRNIARLEATDSLNVTVRDITRPIAYAGPDRMINQHERIDLDGARSSDNVGIVNYTWTFAYSGDTVTLEGAVQAFTFDDAGNYTIDLNVSDVEGNWATDSLTVGVRDSTSPTANAGPDVTVDQHTRVILNGSASWDNVGIVNYTWSFVYIRMQVSFWGAIYTYLFNDAGQYMLTLTVRDERGLTASDTMIVIVLDVDPPVARTGEDVTVDQGETIALDGRASTDNVGIAEAMWTLMDGDSTRTLTGLLTDFTFIGAGVYDVTLTVKDAMGNEATDKLTVTVRDIEPPVAMAGADVHIDQHQKVELDARGSVDNIGIVLWTWTLTYRGAPVTLQGGTGSQLFDDAGTYTVNLTVADAAGNTATDSLTVTVKDTTEPVADAGPEVTVDQSNTLALDGSYSTDNVGIVEWEWTFVDKGTPITLSGKLQRYTFTSPGHYNVTLTVKDAEGNKDDTVLLVRVRDIIAPTVRPPNNITCKMGDRTRLDGAASTDNVGIVKWEWTFRDGGKDVKLEGATVSYAFKDKGDHTVTLSAYDAEGNSAAKTFTVTVTANNALLYAAILIVVLVLVAIALVALRRRGLKPHGEDEMNR